MSAGNAEAARKRDNAFVIAGLTGIVAIAWAYMIYLARDPTSSTRVSFWLSARARTAASSNGSACSRSQPILSGRFAYDNGSEIPVERRP
jgi:predicted metal-binding membrane protein